MELDWPEITTWPLGCMNCETFALQLSLSLSATIFLARPYLSPEFHFPNNATKLLLGKHCLQLFGPLHHSQFTLCPTTTQLLHVCFAQSI